MGIAGLFLLEKRRKSCCATRDRMPDWLIAQKEVKIMRLRQVPPILVNIIHTALSVCDGVRFSAGNTCPRCGGPLSGYDERKRRFAVLVDKEEENVVQVIIRRSWCRQCERIIDPPGPFYPGTRIGAPVVDLCRAFSGAMPSSRASAYLERMGVIVDRWTVRHYSMLPMRTTRTIDVFDMKIPVSIISLSTLGGSMQGAESPGMDTVLEACEYPSTSPAGPEQAPRGPLQRAS
jgi:hypothetical protein